LEIILNNGIIIAFIIKPEQKQKLYYVTVYIVMLNNNFTGDFKKPMDFHVPFSVYC